MNDIRWFRLISFIEGISLLVLMLIAVPMKRAFDPELPVSQLGDQLVTVLGSIHGVLFHRLCRHRACGHTEPQVALAAFPFS